MATLMNARFSTDPMLQQVAAGAALIKKGSRGDGVLAVQQALCDMGFSIQAYAMGGRQRGGPDGDFGGQSDTAVRNFQRHAARFYPQVSADGVIGAVSLAALDALAPEPGKRPFDAGQRCQLPVGQWEGQALRGVVVLDEHRTFLYDDAGAVQAIYANASGKGSSRTDPGLKRVDGVLNEAQARAAGERLWGDGSVFGLRIVNLSWADGSHSGEELHGTNRPDHMGKEVSHGCMRHYNEDIVALADRVKVGDLVAVVRSMDDGRLGGRLSV